MPPKDNRNAPAPLDSEAPDEDIKHPGTAGLMPVKGTTCGLRPNLDEMPEDTEFDFSMAKELLDNNQS